MSIAALIRRMRELGAPMEAIEVAVEAIEAEQSKDAARKAKRAQQKAEERARKRFGQGGGEGGGSGGDSRATVARQGRDMSGDPPCSPPKPPGPLNTPPLSPQPSEADASSGDGAQDAPPDAPQASNGANGHAAKARPPPRACRIPDDFALTPDRIQAALNQDLDHDRIQREFDKFRDHWLSSGGPSALKRDWDAAWRNWCRKAAEGFGGPGRTSTGGNRNQTGGYVESARRVAARFSH